ncbi:MAG: efflux RND transporter permease subunit [Planctomycetota bacterium]
MDLVKLSINKPVGVAVGAILLVFAGLISVGAIPVQLTPTVDTPLVTVTTAWAGRSPQEIVDEITKEQEERLKNVENLEKMVSTSNEGESQIILEFKLGTDLGRALQEVSDALRQVPDYPADVDEPTIEAAGAGPENAIAWIIVDLDPAAADKHTGFDVSTLFQQLDDEVKPFLERTEGIAQVNIYGGREREVRVLVNQHALAQRGVNHLDVITALRAENTNVSAGTIAEGKRDYRVRVMGQFSEPEQVLSTIVAFRDSGPVYVRDVASVEVGYVKERGFVRSLGQPAIAINVIRQTGANVVEVMGTLREKLELVESEVLPNLGGVSEGGPVGPDLRIRQVYDETIYIDSSIGLVTQNLYVGGAIAALVLLVFLRSARSTGIVALAIPVSAVGTFVVMLSLGRSLNVISLAGLAFAVGMVVDNAIVVLENIYRKLQEGLPPMQAAYEGGREVFGAVLASTLTTAAVFVPVLTIEEEAGQLFRDIAIAIVGAVLLSMLVSITLIPSAASRWLGPRSGDQVRGPLGTLFGLDAFFGARVRGLSRLVAFLCTGWRAHTLRPAVIVGMTGLSLAGAAFLAPPSDYLPAGNRNLVFGGLLIPPGLSVDQQASIAQTIEDRIEPYMTADPRDAAAVTALPQIPIGPLGGFFEPVAIDNMFVGAFGGSMFCGATSADATAVAPVSSLLSGAMNGIPDTFGGARQSSVFGRGFGGGTSVDIEISGPDLSRVVAAAQTVYLAAVGDPTFGPMSTTPDPSNFNLTQPEYHVRLNRLARELGFRADAVGVAVQGLFDGAFVDDYDLDGNYVNLVVLPDRGRLEHFEELAQVPVASPAGPIVPIDTVVDIKGAKGPQAIRRVEELAAVTIKLTPPPGIPVEEAQRTIVEQFVAPLYEPGANGEPPLVDRTMRVRLEGTAASLGEVQSALFGSKPEPGEKPAWTNASLVLGVLVLLGFTGLAVFAAFRPGEGRRPVYAVVALLAVGITVAGIFFGLWNGPQLLTARFAWALAVTYLLMCALFDSFVYPLVIMFSVPLAVVGGFAGLAVVHRASLADPLVPVQNLDVLTMLGFVILIGVVVNNAILLVHQALNFMRGDGLQEPMSPADAIGESVRTRVRPIFMSTLTSVGGMLPLVLVPGPGSEMYRGLGSVVVGGLLVATVFTLLLVPLLFSLTLDLVGAAKAAFRGGPESPTVSTTASA